jgi:hypothetical protein
MQCGWRLEVERQATRFNCRLGHRSFQAEAVPPKLEHVIAAGPTHLLARQQLFSHHSPPRRNITLLRCTR